MSHAILSASSAHRWINCPPSARLSEGFSDTRSEAAAEGTLAHELCEIELKHYFDSTNFTKRKRTMAVNRLKKDELWKDEMLWHAATYLDEIKRIALSYQGMPHVAIEKKVDFSKYVPKGFGTADCIIIGGDTLNIVDLKYGKGVPVTAESNEQMRLYALGAVEAYNMVYKVEKVAMTIVQPRLDSITSEVLSLSELEAWGKSIAPIAELAIKGEGDFNPSNKVCKFCRAKSTCRARAESNIELAQLEFKKPPLLSNKEVGEILKVAKDLETWAKDLSSYALEETLNGRPIEGWKVVEGRSNRAFTKQDEAFKVLIENDVEEDLLYERKPLTLTKVENLVGKKTFSDLLNDYVHKPPGKPTLVSEDDKREPLKSSAEKDFS